MGFQNVDRHFNLCFSGFGIASARGCFSCGWVGLQRSIRQLVRKARLRVLRIYRDFRHNRLNFYHTHGRLRLRFRPTRLRSLVVLLVNFRCDGRYIEHSNLQRD